MNSLKQRVHDSFLEWEDYCSNPHVRVSSMVKTRLENNAYRELVEMGREALYYIREEFESRKGKSDLILCLPTLVEEICGSQEFCIPEEIAGKTRKLYDHTMKWLGERYCA